MSTELLRTQTCDLPAYSIMPQPSVLLRVPFTKDTGRIIAGPRANAMYYNILFRLPAYGHIPF
jgi:hypothetical protein